MYYLRTRAAADAIKFTVDQQALARRKAARAATAANPDVEPLKVLPPPPPSAPQPPLGPLPLAGKVERRE